MVIDFEHHYVPAELAPRLGIKSDAAVPVRQGDASIHARLFDLEAQLEDMDRVGIDTAVQSCIAIRPERMVFATDYPQNFNNSNPKLGKSLDGIGEYIETIRRLRLDAKVLDGMLGGTAARPLKFAV